MGSYCIRTVALACVGYFLGFSYPGACRTPEVYSLAKAFAQPPASTRPWVYWMWMDGNLSREGITADLEAMNRAGIGGAIIMEVNVGIPRGNVNFMSPEWRALFKHAVKEAERLGLVLCRRDGARRSAGQPLRSPLRLNGWFNRYRPA